MNMKKTYTIFAGVNGAGKSTLYQAESFDKNESRINTDEIVQRIGNWRNVNDQMKAGHIAVRQIKEYMENGISFNQETTLTGKSIINIIRKAEAHGFQINMYYVGVENAELAMERVKIRVLKDGHDIPKELIKKRYQESLNNIQKVIPFCDKVRFYDNSNYITIVCEITNNAVGWKTPCKWLDPIIVECI